MTLQKKNGYDPQKKAGSGPQDKTGFVSVPYMTLEENYKKMFRWLNFLEVI